MMDSQLLSLSVPGWFRETRHCLVSLLLALLSERQTTDKMGRSGEESVSATTSCLWFESGRLRRKPRSEAWASRLAISSRHPTSPQRRTAVYANQKCNTQITRTS
jgi:hypothetical protein